MPEDVQDTFGHAWYLAQLGERHRAAKPLKGFSGAEVLEVVEDYEGNTYRAVYTVKIGDAILCPACIPKEVKKWPCNT